jgi:hypothetical protein
MDLPVLREASGGSHYKRALQMGVPREKLQFILRPHQDMADDYGDISLVNRFIVGTAISYSRPGDTVDIILHRMNYTSTTVNGNLAGLGAVNNDPRISLLGKFLAKTVGEDALDNAAEGVQEFEEVVMRISDPDVREAIDKARGNTGPSSLTSLLQGGSVLDLYDKNLRLRLLEEKSADIAATATTYGKGTNTEAQDRDAIRTELNTTPLALSPNNGKMLYDDVETYLKANFLQAQNEKGIAHQIINVGAIASILVNLQALGNEVAATFNDATNPSKSLFVDRNAPTNPGVGPTTFDNGTKDPTTAVTGDLANRALSLMTTPPKISAAVGSSSKSKKKK